MKNRWSPPPVRVGEKNNKTKLTADQVLAIRDRLTRAKWGDINQMAREFSVSKVTIFRIRDRDTWKHI